MTTTAITPEEREDDGILSDWAAEQRAEQAKRWAIVAVITDKQDAIVLNYGGFGNLAFGQDGVGSWAEDEGLGVPRLDRGIYYVSDIGVQADEDNFEAWGEWKLVAPLTPEIASLTTRAEKAEQLAERRREALEVAQAYALASLNGIIESNIEAEIVATAQADKALIAAALSPSNSEADNHGQ